LKNTFASIILFLSLFAFVAYSNYKLNILCDFIQSSCTEVDSLIQSGSFEEASIKTDQILSTIKDNHLLSSIYLNHTDFDILSCEALKLSIYVEAKNDDESYVSANLLKCYACNIKKLHRPTLENIF
jgi:hypothetical protein